MGTLIAQNHQNCKLHIEAPFQPPHVQDPTFFDASCGGRNTAEPVNPTILGAWKGCVERCGGAVAELFAELNSPMGCDLWSQPSQAVPGTEGRDWPDMWHTGVVVPAVEVKG